MTNPAPALAGAGFIPTAGIIAVRRRYRATAA